MHRVANIIYYNNKKNIVSKMERVKNLNYLLLLSIIQFM